MGRFKSTLDESDYQALRVAMERLSCISAGGDPNSILLALKECVPVEAGLVGQVKLTPIPQVTNHPLQLPTELLESWMGTNPEQLEQAFRPVVISSPGDFWSQTDSLPERLRDQLEVLHQLDRFNLGEGAGYKVCQRVLPGGGIEHVMMALITDHQHRFPDYTAARLKALGPAVQDAFWRLGLPLIASNPILGQLMTDDATGFICLDMRGSMIELNQRAHELASKYREAAGITQTRDFLQEFINRAWAKMPGNWQLVHASREAVLEVRVHALSKETHMISNDIQLIKMQEWIMPPPPPQAEEPDVPPELSKLTPRQQQAALLLGRSTLGYKQIADRLGIKPGTMRTHAENLYRALNVHSRPELISLMNRKKR